MAEAKVEIDEDIIRQATAKAIADALSPSKRDELLRAAITHVIQDRHSHRDNKSYLQFAFDLAVEKVVREIVEKEVDNDSTRTKVRELVADAWTRLFEQDQRDKVCEDIASAIRKGLLRERY
jgi:hypothetical protein